MRKVFRGEKRNRLRVLFGGIGLLFVCSILVLGVMIWVGRTEPQSSAGNGDSVLHQITAELNPGQEVIADIPAAGVTVFIPGEAITFKGSLSVIPQEANLFSSPGDIWSRPNIINVSIFNISGAEIDQPTFSLPLYICFRLNDIQIELFNKQPKDLQIQFWEEDVANNGWQELPTFYLSERQQLCGETKHLTLFSLSIIGASLPEESLYEYGPGISDQAQIEIIPGKEQSLHLVQSGVDFHIPANTGISSGVVFIKSVSTDAYPSTSEGWHPSRIVDIQILDNSDLEIDTINFENPFFLCFTLTDAQWDFYLDKPETFVIQFLDESGSPSVWVDLLTAALEENHQLCAPITHLSIFALAQSESQVGIEPPGLYEP